MKYLSPKAKSVVRRCAQAVCTSVEDLRRQFEEETPDSVKNNNTQDYARNFVEFCCFKALSSCPWKSTQQLSERCFSSLVFDMMIAWESPSSAQEEQESQSQGSLLREKQERQIEREAKAKEDEEESSLFYSDLMPMLVDTESTIGLSSFTRLAPAIPLVADVVSAHFQFQAFTASTGGRLPFPVFDKYLKELDKSIKLVKSQSVPTLNLSKGEMVIQIDGTGTSQRVVRHIGGTSWPGRLTLTNYALYFETSGVISYEKPIKFDLSTDTQHQVKAGLTGPWGAPLFDKAVIYESSDINEPLILEFTELIGSTRRDYWLALIKEVISVHKFIRKFQFKDREAEEALARSVVSMIRLHATREIYQIFPPHPENLLTFTLSEELLPGGDYVSQALANSIKSCTEKYERNKCFCSAAALVLDDIHKCEQVSRVEEKEVTGMVEGGEAQVGEWTPLETTVQQSTKEAKKTQIARASIEGLRAEGIGGNGTILKTLLSPLMNIVPPFQELLTWKRPFTTASVFLISLVITYMEWIGYALSAFIFIAAGFLIWIRRTEIKDINEIVVSTSSDQSTMESVVSAQQAINQLHSVMLTTNITILKLLSIALSKPIKHTNQVILGFLGLAVIFLILPMKIIIMGIIVHIFTNNLRVRQSGSSDRSARRIKDWWDSVPAIPVRLEK